MGRDLLIRDSGLTGIRAGAGAKKRCPLLLGSRKAPPNIVGGGYRRTAGTWPQLNSHYSTSHRESSGRVRGHSNPWARTSRLSRERVRLSRRPVVRRKPWEFGTPDGNNPRLPGFIQRRPWAGVARGGEPTRPLERPKRRGPRAFKNFQGLDQPDLGDDANAQLPDLQPPQSRSSNGCLKLLGFERGLVETEHLFSAPSDTGCSSISRLDKNATQK